LRRFSTSVFLGAVFASALSAQFGIQQVADRDIGHPPQAPFITFLGIVSPGRMATDPSLPLNGPVAEVLYEELRAQETPAGPGGDVIAAIRTKYDEAGLPIQESRKEWGTETATVNWYEGTRLVSQETTFRNSGKLRPKSWNYWVYDQSGKLIEYRRGSGDQIQNRYTNFKRDAQGRMTSFEYWQGANDALFGRTEFRYSSDGKTIESVFFDATGADIRSTIQTMDDQGHVSSVVIRERDWKTKKSKAPVRVPFRYDANGRVMEQNTDADTVGRASEELQFPPGRVSITYDDVKRTKTTVYEHDENFLSSKVTYNAGGSAIAITSGTGGNMTDVKLECTYDSHENWTACQQIANQSNAATAVKMWRRIGRIRDRPVGETP
jgi:hypothetical protein